MGKILSGIPSIVTFWVQIPMRLTLPFFPFNNDKINISCALGFMSPTRPIFLNCWPCSKDWSKYVHSMFILQTCFIAIKRYPVGNDVLSSAMDPALHWYKNLSSMIFVRNFVMCSNEEYWEFAGDICVNIYRLTYSTKYSAKIGAMYN